MGPIMQPNDDNNEYRKIGEKICSRRKELGLSLRQLASKTDLSASFLSLVENGESSPSLASLHRIARALDLPIFELYNRSATGSPIIRKNNRHRIVPPDSKIGYELLTPDLSRKMMFLLINLQAGAHRTCEPLARPTEQWIYVISGKLKLKIGEEEYLLLEEDSIYFEGDSLKEFASADEGGVSFLNAVTPPAL
jgi:transcriptional regulator with XRE-family HTH domain